MDRSFGPMWTGPLGPDVDGPVWTRSFGPDVDRSFGPDVDRSFCPEVATNGPAHTGPTQEQRINRAQPRPSA